MKRETIYQGTKATFKGCRRPSRKPDYTSYNKRGEISSEYMGKILSLVEAMLRWRDEK